MSKPDLRENVPLADLTTFHIGGPTRYLLLPTGIEEARQSIHWITDRRLPYFVLGGGSNVLCGDAPWEGAVLSTSAMRWLSIDGHVLTVGAGMPSNAVAHALQASGLAGLEFLSGLPGSIGGAVVMNARAYGQEISETMLEAVAMSPSGAVRSFHISEMDYAYKHSALQKDGWICLAARFRLTPGDPAAIRTRMDANLEDRVSKRQFVYPSAGCVFKNCYERNLAIGKLVDDLGLKGLRIGGGVVSVDHGNFIVNLDNATAADIRALIRRVQEEILAKEGFTPECEIVLLGNH